MESEKDTYAFCECGHPRNLYHSERTGACCNGSAIDGNACPCKKYKALGEAKPARSKEFLEFLRVQLGNDRMFAKETKSEEMKKYWSSTVNTLEMVEKQYLTTHIESKPQQNVFTDETVEKVAIQFRKDWAKGTEHEYTWTEEPNTIKKFYREKARSLLQSCGFKSESEVRRELIEMTKAECHQCKAHATDDNPCRVLCKNCESKAIAEIRKRLFRIVNGKGDLMGNNLDLCDLLGLPQKIACPRCKKSIPTYFDDYDIECGEPRAVAYDDGNMRLDVHCDECEFDFVVPVECKVMMPRRCRVCGCTDEHGCEEGCSWVESDLCSVCADKAEGIAREKEAR